MMSPLKAVGLWGVECHAARAMSRATAPEKSPLVLIRSLGSESGQSQLTWRLFGQILGCTERLPWPPPRLGGRPTGGKTLETGTEGWQLGGEQVAIPEETPVLDDGVESGAEKWLQCQPPVWTDERATTPTRHSRPL